MRRTIARRVVALWDLANSPLQTLEMSSAVLRKRHPEEAPTLDRIDRSLERLERLSRMLRSENVELYPTRHGISFDARTRIGRKRAGSGSPPT